MHRARLFYTCLCPQLQVLPVAVGQQSGEHTRTTKTNLTKDFQQSGCADHLKMYKFIFLLVAFSLQLGKLIDIWLHCAFFSKITRLA